MRKFVAKRSRFTQSLLQHLLEKGNPYVMPLLQRFNLKIKELRKYPYFRLLKGR